MKFSRRTFLFAGVSGAAVAASSAVATGLRDTTDEFEYTFTTIRSHALPDSLNGLRLALLADIHYGVTFDSDWLESIAENLNRERVDLLLLGGDFLWVPDSGLGKAFPVVRNQKLAKATREGLLSPLCESLAERLSMIRTRLGAFAVLGNHDRWLGIHELQKAFRATNVQLLINRGIRIGRNQELEIFGVDDYWNGIPEIPDRFRTLAPGTFRIFLSHNPDYLRVVSGTLPYHLALCGHTHGGQIHLPAIGALTYNVSDLRYKVGLAREHTTNAAVYTSRGLGHVEIPYRFNCRPEVSLIELRST